MQSDYRARVVTKSKKTWKSPAKVYVSCHKGPMNLYTKFCLLNWFRTRWWAIGASLIWYSVRQPWLNHVCCFKRRKIGHVDLWAVNRLPQLTPQHLLSPDCVVIIRTKQGLADSLQLSPCVNLKLIHVDGSDRNMLMPLDLNIGVCDAKTEPITAQFAILPPPYLWLVADS